MDGNPTPAPLTQPTPDEQPSGVNLHHLIAIFRRRAPLIAGVALLVFSFVVLYTFQQTPRYTATAQVMIDPRKQKVMDITEVMSGLGTDSAAIDTEVQILKSRALAEWVVKDQSLDQDPEFNPSLKTASPMARLLHFGRAMAPIKVSDHAPQLTADQHKDVVDRALGGLTVRRLALTYVIELSFTSQDAAKAAQIANSYARGYLVLQLEAKFDATRQANDWLNTKVADLRQQVSDAETAVEQYKVANNLMSANGATLTEQEISGLDSALAAARAQQAEANARLNTAKSQLARGSTGEDVGEAMASPVVQQLRTQRAALTQKIADMEGRYGDQHPELLKAKRELADVDDQMNGEIQRIISSLEAQAQVARDRTAAAAANTAQTKESLVSNNRASIRLNELERNAESIKALYESFLGRYKQTSADQGLEQSDARIVSQAEAPGGPSYPKKSSNFAVGLVLALGAGVGAALLAEALDSGIATAEDAERVLGVPYLGAIPASESTNEPGLQGERTEVLAPIDVVVQRPLSSFSEAFRNLRAAMLYSRPGHEVKVIAITSSLPGEGKTTTSVAMARTVALAGAKVVIVDCDLRQRGVSRILGSQPDYGLIEVLNGQAPLDKALVHDEPSGAYYLPLVRSDYTSKDVFGTDAMKTLLADLRQRFDLVILDTAPVLPVADTRVLASSADLILLLVRWRKTPSKAAESALKLLTSVDGYVAGVALTQVDLRAQAQYGYGDPGYYYKSYKTYYGQ